MHQTYVGAQREHHQPGIRSGSLERPAMIVRFLTDASGRDPDSEIRTVNIEL